MKVRIAGAGVEVLVGVRDIVPVGEGTSVAVRVLVGMGISVAVGV